MTNGTGPMPIAKELGHTISSQIFTDHRASNCTHATKDRMVTLASATAPESRPNPTPTREKNAPDADTLSSVLRPSLCETWLSTSLFFNEGSIPQ